MIARTSIACLMLGLAVGGCSGQSGPGTNDAATANSGSIEEMGPEGGSNVAVTPAANSDNAPVGSADNGNVTPGDANPNNPRPGT